MQDLPGGALGRPEAFQSSSKDLNTCRTLQGSACTLHAMASGRCRYHEACFSTQTVRNMRSVANLCPIR